MKISFDFDETLELEYVQNIVIKLINDKHDVWIVTSRFDENQKLKYSNSDLYMIAEFLNIPNNKIIFTNDKPKWLYLKDQDFDIHVDNDIDEVSDIIKHTKTPAICSEYEDWPRIFHNFLLAKKLYKK